jgi:restriction endonuclease S subunit
MPPTAVSMKSHPVKPVHPVKTPWPKVRLGEVLRHRKEFITIDDVTNYKRPRVQLHVQGIVLRDQVPGALIKTKKQQACRAGEFLVAEIDAKVGGFGIVPESLNGSIVSSHYFLFVVDESKLNLRFLDYFIRTPTLREQVAAQGSTNYAAIRPAHVLGYEIPLPPLGSSGGWWRGLRLWPPKSTKPAPSATKPPKKPTRSLARVPKPYFKKFG